MFNIAASNIGCEVCNDDCYSQRQRQYNSFWYGKLTRAEYEDFFKKCLSLSNLAEIMLEYENLLIDKYGDSAKINIYMTPAAATTKVSEFRVWNPAVARCSRAQATPAQVSEEFYKKFPCYFLTPREFILRFKTLGFKIALHQGYFMIDVIDPDLEPQEGIYLEEEESLNHITVKFRTVNVNKNEIPQDIFVIEECTISNISSLIVVDGRKFNDWEAALEYINKQPSARFKNGIFFKFDNYWGCEWANAVFDGVIALAQKNDYPFYSFSPQEKLEQQYQKYIFVQDVVEPQKSVDNRETVQDQSLLPDGDRLLLEEKWTEALSVFKKALEAPDKNSDIKALEKGLAIASAGIRVKTCGCALRLIPEKFRGRKICMEAVADYGNALRFVPLKFRDYEMCFAAVKSDARALKYVPYELRDRKMCMAAVKRGGFLKDVPLRLRDREMCMAAVSNTTDGQVLKYVPEKLRDRAMSLAVVSNRGLAIKYYIPEEHKDREMYLASIKSIGAMLQTVPKTMIDYEMCLIAVRSYGKALEFVPEKFIDHTICLDAVKEDCSSLKFVPEKFRDREICLYAVKHDIEMLKYVPGKILDHEMYLAIVKNNGYALKYVPEKFRDREVCLAAVQQNGYALKCVPENLLNLEMCLAAVKCYRGALKYVPEKLKAQVTEAVDKK